jgi:RNA polymerase sigma-70 factor (ECF subfamily)
MPSKALLKSTSMNCITQAWQNHESELRAFLQSRIHDVPQAEDLLQDVFIKALAEGGKFCDLENARAWLFRVAKNQLIDFQRTRKEYDEISDKAVENNEKPPVANLATCLPVALGKMNAEDQEIIQRCDLDGMNQSDYAELKELSLTGAKSRIQRARKRLKDELRISCRIIFDDEGNVCCFGDEIQYIEK